MVVEIICWVINDKSEVECVVDCVFEDYVEDLFIDIDF